MRASGARWRFASPPPHSDRSPAESRGTTSVTSAALTAIIDGAPPLRQESRSARNRTSLAVHWHFVARRNKHMSAQQPSRTDGTRTIQDAVAALADRLP